jgi:hypothetical protein
LYNILLAKYKNILMMYKTKQLICRLQELYLRKTSAES